MFLKIANDPIGNSPRAVSDNSLGKTFWKFAIKSPLKITIMAVNNGTCPLGPWSCSALYIKCVCVAILHSIGDFWLNCESAVWVGDDMWYEMGYLHRKTTWKCENCMGKTFKEAWHFVSSGHLMRKVVVLNYLW